MTPFARTLKYLRERNYSSDILGMTSPLFEKYNRKSVQTEVANIIEKSGSEEEAIQMLLQRYPELKK